MKNDANEYNILQNDTKTSYDRSAFININLDTPPPAQKYKKAFSQDMTNIINLRLEDNNFKIEPEDNKIIIETNDDNNLMTEERRAFNKQNRFNSMILYPLKNPLAELNEMHNKELLSVLNDKIKQISNLCNNGLSEESHRNLLKFNLIIVMRILEDLAQHPNINILELEFDKTFLFDLSSKFQSLFPEKTQESLSFFQSFAKISELFEKYISQHQKKDILLRVGSEEEFRGLEKNKESVHTFSPKHFHSNSFIELPKVLTGRTRIMKIEKYSALKVQTKNLEEFRYIGNRKIVNNNNNNNVQINEDDSFTKFFKEHCEIIFAFGCVTVIVVTIILIIFL